jgi:aminoglycoside phosphotransferase (APT) family kinase protein
VVPLDPALPGLTLLRQPARLREAVAPLLADWLGPEDRLVDTRVAAIRHLLPGKRCSAELELVLGPAPEAPVRFRRVLGKLYSDEQGATVYETLRELRDHGFGTGPFLVPQPLAYDADHHLLLLDWAEGESLSARLLTPSAAGHAIERAAAWLLRLHRCGVTSGRRYSFGRHVQTLEGWTQQLTAVFPDGERLLADLLGGIEERGRSGPGWDPGPTHRDFSPEHLVVAGPQLVGLDFDEFCQYDPLFDVAHFIAHLRFFGLTRFGAMTYFDWLADRFLASYEADGGDSSEERLRLYEAIAYLKLGRFVALVQPARDWRQLLPALLSEGRRLV